ncbi:CheR family methyltransferase [Salipiger sp. H15]|uniref:CheR family methyltransferase n=1 Tax=Alloyangia sp. H15 TaxID=3029062 RepID=A0AAU8AHS5_9RHOB
MAGAGKNGDADIPLVAIGASAGGLEPLEAFFSAAPPDAGWCFVVLQHLSPDFRSMMNVHLARHSSMQIRVIEDGMEIAPDTIFLNVPDCLIRLEGNRFRVEPYGLGDKLPHLPIDAFFLSLVPRARNRTVGIVLSGSGRDGTRGAKALHDAGGAIVAQSPAQADFSSMPKSVIEAEAADLILDSAQIPHALRAIFRVGGRMVAGLPGVASAPKSILALLEEAHELDFTDYKTDNVQRRIDRRRHLRGLGTLEEYRDLLAGNPAALEELFYDLLIGVTEFYRDADAIRALRRNVLDPLVRQGDQSVPLRVWVAACASGEEAYTIAIELSEAIAAAGSKRKFRVIATDVHRRSVDHASAGIFTAEDLARVPAELRAKYFLPARDHFIVEPGLRQKIIFSVHNVLRDPPFMNLDLVSCRNLLIYLNDAPQYRLISMFLFGLRKDGYLLLGPSESLGRFASEFRVVDGRWRLFQKISGKRMLDRSVLSVKVGSQSHPELQPRDAVRKPPESVKRETSMLRSRDLLMRSYDALLKRYVPSSILLAENGTVVSWFGAASAFIDTMNNMADWTVEEIVHPGLHFVINVAIEKLREGNLQTYSRHVEIELGDGTRHFEVTVEPVGNVRDVRLVLLVLAPAGAEGRERDAATPAEGGAATPAGEDIQLLTRRIQEQERDLRLTEETLQHVTERLEASGEELQASNEELQASNEELQASNEELQSSNEELHAVNEELLSVSSEHERQIEMLSELNRSTELVLGVLDVGVITLDRECRILRFSQIIARKFELEAHDTSRSLAVVGPRLGFADLLEMAREVLASGISKTAEGAHEGRKLTVIAQPYGEEGNEGGAVLIFRWGD